MERNQLWDMRKHVTHIYNYRTPNIFKYITTQKSKLMKRLFMMMLLAAVTVCIWGQSNVDSLLKERMRSTLNIDSAFIIVMDNNSGSVIAMEGMRKKEGADNIDYWIGGLSPATIMDAAT